MTPLVAAALLLAAPAPKPAAELDLDPAGPVAAHNLGWIGFSPAGDRLAVWLTGSDGKGVIRVWGVPDGKTVAAVPADPPGDFDRSSRCAFTPDGRLLIAGWKEVRVVTPGKTDEVTLTGRAGLPGGNSWPQVVWAAGEKPRYHLADVDGSHRRSVAVRRWDPDRPADPTLFLPPDRVPARYIDKLAFAPGSGRLAIYDESTSGAKHVLQVYDLSTGADLGAFSHPGRVTALALDHGGGTLVAGYDPFSGPSLVRVWDLTAGKQVATLSMPLRPEAVAVSPDGKTLACGFRTHLGSATLKLFALPAGHELGRAAADRTAVDRLAFSPDGRWLATCGTEGMLRVWDADRLDTRGR